MIDSFGFQPDTDQGRRAIRTKLWGQGGFDKLVKYFFLRRKNPSYARRMMYTQEHGWMYVKELWIIDEHGHLQNEIQLVSVDRTNNTVLHGRALSNGVVMLKTGVVWSFRRALRRATESYLRTYYAEPVRTDEWDVYTPVGRAIVTIEAVQAPPPPPYVPLIPKVTAGESFTDIMNREWSVS